MMVFLDSNRPKVFLVPKCCDNIVASACSCSYYLVVPIPSFKKSCKTLIFVDVWNCLVFFETK